MTNISDTDMPKGMLARARLPRATAQSTSIVPSPSVSSSSDIGC